MCFCCVSWRWDIVLCRVSPCLACLHYHHVTLQIHFLCWIVTKENQIILNWVLSSTRGNYCQNWATLCWSVTSRVWGLCCGFLIPVPPQPPQVATSLQSASRMTVASVGAQEEETILIPPSPTWPSVGNKTSIPSTLFRYDLAWRGGLAHKKCHPLFYNPRNRQFGEQSVMPVDQDGTTEGQSW